MNGPRPRVTWPFLIVTAPLPCPDSALTSWAWATVLSRSQARAKAGLVTILCTWAWMNPVTAPARDGPKLRSSPATRGRPWLASAVAAVPV